MKSPSFIARAVLSCCAILLWLHAARVSAAQTVISDIIRPPVNLSLNGVYYPDPRKNFSVDVSGDRFIKDYSDGTTIIGIRGQGETVYYIIDRKKQMVLKVSQTNLYRIGQFFNWETITSLTDLPADAAVIAGGKGKDGCTLYAVAGSDVELCVDGNHHVPVVMTKKGEDVARITSVKPLGYDLKARVDTTLLECRQRSYIFFDADSEIGPDAD